MEAINGLVSGKNVLITGGAAGLGHAFLNHFLKHGANVSSKVDFQDRLTFRARRLIVPLVERFQKVTIFDIDAETGKKIEQSVEKSCGEKKVYFVQVDVSNYARMTGE